MRSNSIAAALGAMLTMLVALPLPHSQAAVLPMTPEQCLSRDPSQITRLEGELAGSLGSGSTQSDRTWDLREFSHTTSPTRTRYPFELQAARRVCIIGGSVIGDIPRDYSREQFYDTNTDGIEWDNEAYRPQHTADSPWIVQHGSYAENVSDAFDTNGLANGINHTYLDRVHAKDIRDDCVEAEGSGFSPHTMTITDSLFDGCHNFLSMRPTGTSHADAGTSEGTLTIDNSLVHVKPNELGASNCAQNCTTIGGVPHMGNHVLFKWSSAAVKNVVVRDTVFRIDQPSAWSTRAMNWPAGQYENVKLVWTWPKPHTDYFQVPAGVTVTNDVQVWDNAKAAWLGRSTSPAEPVNVGPAVQAGQDVSTTIPAPAALSGTVVDDGLPSTPGSVSTAWSMASGPSAVSFSDPSALNSTVSLSVPGTYVLRLTATDGAIVSHDDITVSAAAATLVGQVLSRRVQHSADDVEQDIKSGSQDLTSSDLEVGHDGSKRQKVGLRFTGISIPQGARVSKAYVQFTARSTGTATTTATIRGHASDASPAFTSAARSMDARTPTDAAATWSPGPWRTVGESSTAQRTPPLEAIVQEIVNRSGWTSGSPISFQIEGLLGARNAWGYDGSTSRAPVLHVEYAPVA